MDQFNLLEFMSDWNKHFWSNQRCTSNDFFIVENDTSMRPFPFFGGNSFIGGLISKRFSLWLKSPKISAKSLSRALYTTEKMLRRVIWYLFIFEIWANVKKILRLSHLQEILLQFHFCYVSHIPRSILLQRHQSLLQTEV